MPNGEADIWRDDRQVFLEENLLEDILSHENMHRAWKRVKRNKGAPGIDGISVDAFPEYTERSWGVSMSYRMRKLAEYIRGWMGYYGISEYYRPIPGLDEWARRRIRMCY